MKYISNVHLSSGGFFGGLLVSIQEFIFGNESWTGIGIMKEGRKFQAVSTVSFDAYEKWCN